MFIDKNKLWGIGAVVLILVAYLAGSGSSDKTPVESAPTAEDTYTPEVVTPEERYIENLHSLNDPLVEQNTDADLLELGQSVCEIYDNGYSTYDIIDELVYNSGLSTDAEFTFAGEIIGSAVKYLCPEYMSDLQGYTNS
jgi:hypothetical protein